MIQTFRCENPQCGKELQRPLHSQGGGNKLFVVCEHCGAKHEMIWTGNDEHGARIYESVGIATEDA